MTMELENEFKELESPLRRVCEATDVVPLFMADCGSRSWGFSTPNSDWDVKFVYKQADPDKYLSLFEPEQHFSFQRVDGTASFDGWDLKKLMLLMMKGNANVYEVLNSQYFSVLAEYRLRDLRPFADNALANNLVPLVNHYVGLSHNTYRDRIKGVGEPTMKKWFYVVRPLLCANYMFLYKKLPPLDFESLLNSSVVCDDFDAKSSGMYDQMFRLLKAKREQNEQAVPNEEMKCVDNWVQKTQNFYKKDETKYELGEMSAEMFDKRTPVEAYNELYRELLRS